MKHYVMTSAYRGPDYPLDANRRRVELLRGITARSLAAQGTDWTWLVWVHPDDPFREERLDAFRSAGAPVIPIEGDPADLIDWSGPVLTTRIDDDDAFAADAFRRLHAAIRPTQEPTAYLFPFGYHVRDGRVALHRHLRNAWSSLYAPAGFREHIRLVQHQRVPGRWPVVHVDVVPAWLRVSHLDNDRPTSHRPRSHVTASVRARYPIDWSLLEPLRVAA